MRYAPELIPLSRIGTLRHTTYMGAYSFDDASLFRAAEAAARADVLRPARAPWLSGTSTASISRLLFTRVLPGSAVVLASFTLPGLSLGAGFLAQAPSSRAGQSQTAKLAPAPTTPTAPTVRAAPVNTASARPRLRFIIAPDAAPARPTGASSTGASAGRIAPLAVPPRPVAAPVLLPDAAAAPVAMAATSARPLADAVSAAPKAAALAPLPSTAQPAFVAAPAAAKVPAGSVSASVPAAPPAAIAPLPQAKPQLPATAAGRVDALRVDVKSQLLARIDGKSAGKIDFRQTDAGLQVRLGSIADLLGDRYDAAQLARIRASSASNVYISLAELQAQGIPISYDPVYDEFNVGTLDTRPKARMKVHMDQISTPERGLGSTAMEQVRR